MALTKDHVVGAVVGCACCCIVVALGAGTGAILVASGSGPGLGSANACAACPRRRCEGRGYAYSAATNTLARVEAGVGLANCLCEFCKAQCNAGGQNFLLINGWTTNDNWYRNVFDIKGVCTEYDVNCGYGSVCGALDGPRVQGSACTSDFCLSAPPSPPAGGG